MRKNNSILQACLENKKRPSLCLPNNRFAVPSQSQENVCYEVSFLDRWKCTCPHYTKRHAECKHIGAVQEMVLDMRKLETVHYTIKKPEPTCTNDTCRSTNCRHYDERKRKDGDISVRYRCNACGKRFTYRPGFLGRHYPDTVITNSINYMVVGASRILLRRVMLQDT